MKDYKLSEIKAICDSHEECRGCPFERPIRCLWILNKAPRDWQIDEEEKQSVNPANLENEKVFKRNKEKSDGTGLNIC